MRRLTTGNVLRNASLGEFVLVRTCIYTNLLPCSLLHT